MPMNVRPIPTIDERMNDIRMRTAGIVNDYILPNEAKLWNLRRNGEVSQHERREALQLREEIATGVGSGALGTSPPEGIRRDGTRLPRPRLHE